MGSAYQFHSWRVFVLVCAFPSVFAIGALTTQPESPRFFLEVTGLRLSCGGGEGSARAPVFQHHCGFGLILHGCLPPSQGPSSVGLYLPSFVRMYLQKGPGGWRSEGTCSTMGGLKFYRWGPGPGPGPSTISWCSRLRSSLFSAYVLSRRHHLPCFEFSLPLDQEIPRTYACICLPPLLPTPDDILLCPRLGLFPSG